MSDLRLAFNKRTGLNHLVEADGSTIEFDYGALQEGLRIDKARNLLDLTISSNSPSFGGAGTSSSDTIVIDRTDGTSESSSGSTPAELGSSLINIMASAVEGDIISLGPGEYDLGAAQLVISTGAILKGAGKYLTTITGTRNNSTPQVVLGDLCVVDSLGIVTTNAGVFSSVFDIPIGNTTWSAATPLRATLNNVRTVGESYGILVDTDAGTGGMLIHCRDCDFASQGNAARFETDAEYNGYVYFENVTLDCTGTGLTDVFGLNLGAVIDQPYAPVLNWNGGSCSAHHTAAAPVSSFGAAIGVSLHAKLSMRGVTLSSLQDNTQDQEIQAHDFHCPPGTSGIALVRLEDCTYNRAKVNDPTGIRLASFETEPAKIEIGGTISNVTDLYGCGMAGSALTGDILSTTATNFYSEKISYTGGTLFGDLTASSQEVGYTSDNQPFPDTPANNDAVYFISRTRFCNARFVITTAATYTGDGTIWEYYNGSAWATLTILDVTDATAGNGLRAFQTTAKGIQFLPPANWALVTIDTSAGYAIRCRLTTAANQGTSPVFSTVHRKYQPVKMLVAPRTGNIVEVIITDRASTIHSGNAVTFFLFNHTLGISSALMSFSVNRRRQAFSGTALHADSQIDVSTGNKLWVYCMGKDGTNEVTNASIEIVIDDAAAIATPAP